LIMFSAAFLIFPAALFCFIFS